MIAPITGSWTYQSKSLLSAVDFIVQRLNAEEGFAGLKLKLIKLDNRGTAIGSQKAAEKAIELGVSAVIGPFRSSNAMAAAPVLQTAKIPMITPLATNPRVTRIGNFIFRTCFTDEIQARYAARFAREHFKANKASLLVNSEEIYAVYLCGEFAAEFQKLGGTIVSRTAYKESDSDFSGIVRHTSQADPDIVFLPGFTRDSGLIIKQSRAMGFKAPFLGADGWQYTIIEIAGNTLQGSAYTTHWHPKVDPDGLPPVLEAYQNEHTIAVGDDVVLLYDTFLLLEHAVRKAASTTPPALRDALASTRNLRTVSGTLSLDQNGDPMDKEIVFLQYQNGDWEPVVFKP